MTTYYSTASLEAAAGFLQEDLLDSVESQRLRAETALKDGDPEMAKLHKAAAVRLEELADEVDEIPDPLLLEYERALELEQEQDGPTGALLNDARNRLRHPSARHSRSRRCLHSRRRTRAGRSAFCQRRRLPGGLLGGIQNRRSRLA